MKTNAWFLKVKIQFEKKKNETTSLFSIRDIEKTSETKIHPPEQEKKTNFNCFSKG